MAKFTVQLVTRVPIFADVVVEADSHTDAQAMVEAMARDGDEQLTSIQWRHGEGAEHPIAFTLDERDIAEIDVQGVAKVDERIPRIAAFYAKHGDAWGIIEQSGMERERHTGALYATQKEALDARDADYTREEREDQFVDIAHWDGQGEFWSYDH